MNHWPFILAAYLVTLSGMAGLVGFSLFAMRRAEAEAERVSRRS